MELHFSSEDIMALVKNYVLENCGFAEAEKDISVTVDKCDYHSLVKVSIEEKEAA